MAPAPALSGDTVQNAISDLNLISIPTVLESLLFGMFILMYIYAVLSLYDKRGIPRRSMLIVTTIMFISSATHWALILYSFLRLIRDPHNYHIQPNYLAISTALTFCLGVNFFFSDAIVLWRACILWQGSYIVYGISTILLSSTLISATLEVALVRHRYVQADIAFPTPNVLSDGFAVVCISTSLLTNIWATILVGIKAWRYRRAIWRDLQQSSSANAIKKTMSVLVECGALYCLIWTFFIIGFMTDPNPDVLGGYENTVDLSVSYIVAQATGIYPTIIVVLVRYQRTYNEQTFNLSTISDMAFDAPVRSINVTIAQNASRSATTDSLELESTTRNFRRHSSLPQNDAPKTPTPASPTAREAIPVVPYPLTTA